MKRTTIRRSLVVAVVCGATALGAGTVAYAATDHPGTTSGPGYGYGRPGGGPEGGPGGEKGGAHAPHLTGTVTAVSGTKITIKDRDGFIRQISTSSSTKFADGTLADVKTGQNIHAEGTVDADGVTLDATSVGTFTAPAAGERPAAPSGEGPAGPSGEGPAGPGHGGPSGSGERPTPPTGAPTAS